MKCKSADPAKIGGVGGLSVCKLLKVNALESANPPTGGGGVLAGRAPSGKVFPELRPDALSAVSVKVSS